MKSGLKITTTATKSGITLTFLRKVGGGGTAFPTIHCLFLSQTPNWQAARAQRECQIKGSYWVENTISKSKQQLSKQGMKYK